MNSRGDKRSINEIKNLSSEPRQFKKMSLSKDSHRHITSLVHQNMFASPTCLSQTVYSNSFIKGGNSNRGNQSRQNQRQKANGSSCSELYSPHQSDQLISDSMPVSQNQRDEIEHYQEQNPSIKLSDKGSRLDFLGQTQKSEYIDIKSKRVHDLNTLYLERSSADFNSQNVFMNKLVYHSTEQKITASPTDLKDRTHLQQNICASDTRISTQESSYGIVPPRNQLNRKNQSVPQLRIKGLQNFVKTMYSNPHTKKDTQSSYIDTSIQKTQNSVEKINQESYDDKLGGFKTRDLFITKLSHPLCPPKFLLFQNKSEYFNPGRDSNHLPTFFENSQKKNIYLETQPSLQKNVSVKNENTDPQRIFLKTFLHPEQWNPSQEEILPPLVLQTLNDSTGKNASLKNNSILFKQQSSCSEFYLPDTLDWSYEYLFIFIDNLSQVKRKNNLKYTFIPIPQVANMMSEKKLLADFGNLKEILKSRLQINSKDIYLFLDDGKPMRSHMDIVRSDTKEWRAVFVGGCGGFCGLDNLFNEEERRETMRRVISELINQNLKHKHKRFPMAQTHTQMKIHRPQKNSQNSYSLKELANPEENVKLSEFQTKEQFVRKENKNVVAKVVNILTHNPSARIKRFEQTFDNPRIQQLEKIEKLYDTQLTQFKKSALETEAASSFGDNPDSKQTKNLRQIAEYIDQFLEKSFPQSQYPIKKAIEECHINQKPRQEDSKRNHVKENIEKFNTSAMAIRRIQKINRELFVMNIPKILSKYELSRRDLHSIYILYKALLTVSIQRIDWKGESKEGIDFKTFEHGIDKISSQSEEIIRRMCNFEDFINWNQFIDILYAVSGKTLESKIDIFIKSLCLMSVKQYKVADTDQSGNLSKTEISELCYICLDKILPKEGEDDSMVQGLVDYFTRLLFTSLDVDPDDEIPLHKLKDAIVNGHPENDLLCFFCGVDYSK